MARRRRKAAPGGEPRRGLLVLLAGALLVKAVVLVQLGAHPLLQPEPGLDGGAYLRLAERVAAGDLAAGEEPFYLAPFYIYFLGGALALPGHALLAAQVLQILLGVAAVGLVCATARHWYGERAGWIAGGLAAAAGVISFHEILILQSALDVFLTALALYLTARALCLNDGALHLTAGALHPSERAAQPNDRKPRQEALLDGEAERTPIPGFGATSTWLAVGAAWGLLALNRPNALVYPLAAALGLALARRGRAGFRAGAALGLGVALAIAPFAWRNYAVAGEWIPIASHGGLNFYIGNNPQADGTYHAVPGITPSIEGQARDARRVAEAARGRPLTARGVSDYFYASAWEWIRSNPAAAAKLFARKLAYLLSAREVALNYGYAYYSRDEKTLLRALLVSPGLLIALGALGLALAPRAPGRPGFWLWAAFVPCYALTLAAFFVAGRYRLPLLVPLAIGAGGALAWGWETLLGRGVRALLPALALTAVTLAFVHRDVGLDDGRAAERAEMVLQLVDNGRFAEARERLARAEADGAPPGLLYFRAGRAFHQKGRTAEAVELLRKAAAAVPEPAVRLSLGLALLDAGEREEAAGHLLAGRAGAPPEIAALELAPALAAAGRRREALELLRETPLPETADAERLTALGGLVLQLGDPKLAEAHLRLALVRAPGLAAAHERLGVALAMTDRLAEARGELEQACRLDPASASARLALATLEAREGRLAQARARAEEALRLRSDYPQAERLLRELAARR